MWFFIEDIMIWILLLEMCYFWGDEMFFKELKDVYWLNVVEGMEGEFV